VGGAIALFGADVLRVWTGEAALAASAAPIVVLLVIGATLNGLVAVPYALQITSGWPELSVRLNIIATIIVIPAMILAAQRGAGKGTAAVWLALNAVYLLVGVPLMYRRLLTAEQVVWWRTDIIVPAAAAALVLFICRFALPIAVPRVIAAGEIAAITCVAIAAAALTTPLVRTAVFDLVGERRAAR
jgi:hypothetical protein